MSTKQLIVGSFVSAAVLALYIVLIVASGAGWNPFGVHWNFTNPGAFGDSFGPLNTLMTAVAAIAAIGAFLSQSAELSRVRKDSEKERRLAQKRDFEATFFNLLELFRETVREIDVADWYGQNPVSGRDALRRLLDEYIERERQHSGDQRKAFRQTYFRFRDDLGHYFRLFYNILRFLRDSSVEDKQLYARLIRATLSDAEIVLIALNCMHGGGEKLRPYVEEYAMLHNISASSARLWDIQAGFDAKAFGDRTLSEGEEEIV